MAKEPPDELDDSVTVVSNGSDVAIGPIWSWTLIALLGVPTVTVCDAEENAAVVGVQVPNALQAGVNAAPSTEAVHHGGAQASSAAIGGRQARLDRRELLR